MQNNFAVTSSPHLRAKSTSRQIMMEVCLALAPAGVASVILFGLQAAILIAICVASCVLAEYGWQKLTKQKVTVGDWSAVVTGLLLAYNLPATAPWWMAVIDSVIAIVLVKQLFGGIGSNFMNPALTARAVLFISWSSLMSASTPAPLLPSIGSISLDVISGATPLNTLNAGSIEGLNLMNLLLGTHGGMLGETCAAAIILGGLYLCVRGIADWRIPASFIGTVFVCYLLMALPSLSVSFAFEISDIVASVVVAVITVLFNVLLYKKLGGKFIIPTVTLVVAICAGLTIRTGESFSFTALADKAEYALYHVLSGGLLLGAFFMATDYATSPITRTGRVVFGIGCGLLLFVIRAFANYPEGCSFAILFMNVATPMIDRFTAPRPFGEVKKHG